MKTFLLSLLLLVRSCELCPAEPLRLFVSDAGPVGGSGHTVVTLFLTGTDDGGYVIERRTQPGPWSDFVTIAPALGFGRTYWRNDDGLVVTIYPGPGYVFPITFIDDAPTATYRAKKL